MVQRKTIDMNVKMFSRDTMVKGSLRCGSTQRKPDMKMGKGVTKLCITNS